MVSTPHSIKVSTKTSDAFIDALLRVVGSETELRKQFIE
jgi:hypothetical protein